MSDAHLHSAGRALCAILAARHPEHTFRHVVRPAEEAGAQPTDARSLQPTHVEEP